MRYIVRGRGPGSTARLQPGTNGDLGSLLACTISDRKLSVSPSKVKAHADYRDLESGLISVSEFIGNRFADEFAGKAAAASQVPDALAEQVAILDARVWKIQTRLVEVLIATGGPLGHLKDFMCCPSMTSKGNTHNM